VNICSVDFSLRSFSRALALERTIMHLRAKALKNKRRLKSTLQTTRHGMDSFDLRLWKGFEQSGGAMNSPAIVDQIVIDSKRIDSKNSLFVALPGLKCDGHMFVGEAIEAFASFALVKRDFLPPSNMPSHFTLLRCDDPLQALQEIAETYRLTKKAKVIAITGSYGKTMVKDLLHAFLSQKKCVISSPESFNSQIGVALSLLNITDAHESAIIEAAISKKGEMERLHNMIQPDAVILTHLANKHETTLGNLHTAASEMMKMCAKTSSNSWQLLPNHSHLQPHLSNIHTPHYFWNEKTGQSSFCCLKVV